MSTAPFHSIPRTKITIIRSEPPALVNGRLQKGAASHHCIQANIQPAKYSEIMMLQEAFRTKQVITIFTKSKLFIMDEASGRPGDIFTYNGFRYQIIKVQEYSMGMLDHFKALAVNIDPPD